MQKENGPTRDAQYLQTSGYMCNTKRIKRNMQTNVRKRNLNEVIPGECKLCMELGRKHYCY
jgi:hypothetical protein